MKFMYTAFTTALIFFFLNLTAGSDEVREDLAAIARLAAPFDKEEVGEEFCELMMRNFNEEEVGELRSFHENPVFRKYLDVLVECKTKNLEKLNSKNFDEVILKADKPAIVFVYAKWCKPCKLLKPIIEQVVDEMSEYCLFAKLDFDKNEGFCKKRLKVKRIPSILLFKEGKLVQMHEGFMTKQGLEDLINEWF